MQIRLVIPDVNAQPTERPTACRWCGHWRLHRHGTVTKPVRDHRLDAVTVERDTCTGCGRTFRHYPSGITRRDQSQRTVVLAAGLYGLGLSCSASAAFLTAIGVSIARMSVWRAAQAVGEVLQQSRPAGTVWVLGADETVFRGWGQPVLVGFVVDGVRGHAISVDLLDSGDAASLLAWLTPYAAAMGAEVLVTDGHDAYGAVASALGVEHQRCLAHVRKAVTKQVRSLQAQAADAWGAGERLEQLEDDLATVRDRVRELPEEGAAKLWPVHARYLGAAPPRTGEAASIASRMRLLTLRLIETWPKLCLAQARPEFGMDGTNTATERAIGKSKLRYKTMRGDTSVDRLRNGIALTQWLDSGATEHDLAQVLAA